MWKSRCYAFIILVSVTELLVQQDLCFLKVFQDLILALLVGCDVRYRDLKYVFVSNFSCRNVNLIQTLMIFIKKAGEVEHLPAVLTCVVIS